MSNVVILPGYTRLDIPVERVCDGAKENIPESIVLAGIDKDGNLWVASSKANLAEAVLLLERARHFCIKQIDG